MYFTVGRAKVLMISLFWLNCNYALYCSLNSLLNFGDVSNTRKSGESIGGKNGAISKSFAVYSESVDAQFSTVVEVCFLMH